MKLVACAMLLSASLALASCSSSDAPSEDVAINGNVISSQEAFEMMSESEVTVLDVRTPEEFSEGYIPHAVLLPLDDISKDSALEVLPSYDETILIYCRSGRRSAEAAQLLVDFGYTKVYDFGGIIDWPYDIIVPSDESY